MSCLLFAGPILGEGYPISQYENHFRIRKDNVMEMLNVFAMIGMAIDDLLSIMSVIGSAILFIGTFSNASLGRYGRIATWSIGGLVFGAFFQLCRAITG